METGSEVAHILEKGSGDCSSRLSINEFKLATNNRLGCDMPRVKLKIICIARFLDRLKMLGLSPCDRIVPDWGGILEEWSDYCCVKMD